MHRCCVGCSVTSQPSPTSSAQLTSLRHIPAGTNCCHLPSRLRCAQILRWAFKRRRYRLCMLRTQQTCDGKLQPRRAGRQAFSVALWGAFCLAWITVACTAAALFPLHMSLPVCLARPVPFCTNLLPCLQRFGACQNGNRCSYAHGPSDRLPHIVTSATLCPILQASCCVCACTQLCHTCSTVRQWGCPGRGSLLCLGAITARDALVFPCWPSHRCN